MNRLEQQSKSMFFNLLSYESAPQEMGINKQTCPDHCLTHSVRKRSVKYILQRPVRLWISMDAYGCLRMPMDDYGTSPLRTCRTSPVRHVLLHNCFAWHLWFLDANKSGQHPCMTCTASIHMYKWEQYGIVWTNYKKGRLVPELYKMAYNGSKWINRIQPYSTCFILQSEIFMGIHG